MLPKFLASLDSWVSIPLKSGLFFWFGGLIAWLYACIDWAAVHQQFSGVNPAPKSLISADWLPVWIYLHNLKPEHVTLLLFTLLFVMMLSNVVVTRLIFPTLRFLEGYGWLWEWRWNSWNPLTWGQPFFERFRFLWTGCNQQINCLAWNQKSLRQRIIEIIDKCYYAPRTHEYHQLGNPAKLSGDKLERHRELENEQLYLLPVEDRLPTQLGNILRGYERRPTQKYGLDMLVCWPHLWMLLSENVQKDLSDARQNLDDAIQIWLWGALLLVWIYWTWWALPVAVILMLVAYSWALQAARTYGKLLETAFDLYRPLLYRALRFPLPEDPKTEVEAGQNLTAYLLRGMKDNVEFEVKAED